MIPLRSIKKQLRIELDDGSQDDELLELIDAAIDMVEQQLNRKLYPDQVAIEADENALPTALIMPASIRRAVLMALTDLYENRGATSYTTLNENPVFKQLISPYRIFPNGH